MAPSSEDLPELRQWSPSDAILEWTFDEEKQRMKVVAFGMQLVPKGGSKNKVQTAFAGINRFFSKLKPGGGERNPRCQPSGADPSALAGHIIDKEEDVLFIKKLPDFDGRISERDSELLLSYLTAPIPLMMQFFADEGR
eukprot:scaffold387612_cov36-Prasinocladus_malaysianus.AAC.1